MAILTPDGLAAAQLRRLSAGSSSLDHDLVVYQFSRSKVEAGDFSHFLSVYGREKLPTGRKLREMMNTLTFVIEGFDADPREVHITGLRVVAAAPACTHELKRDWSFQKGMG